MISKLKQLLRWVFQSFSLLVVAGVGIGLLAAGVMAYQVFTDLPDVSKLKDFHHSHSTEVFSCDGVKVAEFTAERRYPVEFSEVPKHVRDAFIAAEDSHFYEHHGIDFLGILRAVGSNILKGRYAQGASTITQQVARAILLATRKKELTRKFREMVLARRMEQTLTKDEILALYLSEIFLGHRSYGIGAAARNYFNKEVRNLSVAEGALLAGLPQRPTYWNPFRSPYHAKARQRYVLSRMVEEKFITKEQSERAYATELKLYPIQVVNSEAAPYFTEYVRLHLNEKYGEEKIQSEGYRVTTTVRYDFQKAAESALNKGLRDVDKRLGYRGPVQSLGNELEVQEFLSRQHEKLLDEAAAARILPAEVTRETTSLLVDLSDLEKRDSPYFGATPIQEGKYYEAVVLEFTEDQRAARLAIGQTTAELPLEGASWVRVEERPVDRLGQAFKERDVIWVYVENINRKKDAITVSLDQKPEIQGALLSYDVHTGFVLAMVGGRDFVESPFNRALQSKRQVGSTFKPLVYAAAIDKGFSPSSRVTDSPVVFRYESGEEAEYQGEDWKPRNYGQHFVGEVCLREALVRSMNVPTIKVLNEIGVDYTIQYARALGIKAAFPRDLTIALGSWSTSLEEIMRAYSIFPRLGKPVNLAYLTEIKDGSGEVIEKYEPDLLDEELARSTMSTDRDPDSVEPWRERGLVISPQTAYVMIDMLKAVVREGTGAAASVVRAPIAGKTGTSNDFYDAWFVGFSPHVMTGVWVGFDKEVNLGQGEAGGRVAAPIFAEYMKYVVTQYPKDDFKIPEGVVFAYIDKKTGLLAEADNPNRVREAFKQGSVPNSNGDNIARISEPGVRQMTTTPEPGKDVQQADPKPNVGSEAQDEDDYSDLLREGEN